MFTRALGTLVGFLVCHGLTASQRDYSKYQVCRFWNDSGNRDDIMQLVNQATEDFDIWASNKLFVDVRLPRGVLDCEVVIDDLNDAVQKTMARGEVLDEQISQLGGQKVLGLARAKPTFFNGYKDIEEIYEWLHELEERFPELVKVETIGMTPEDREMKVVHISADKNKNNPDKKTIVITGGIHAREWISISTACYILNQLLKDYAKDKHRSRKYLEHLDFLIVPVFNPDGYQYTWTTDRLWRKNRQQTYFPGCVGIDIDHSFDYHWKRSDDSSPCSEDYSGEQPFDALESRIWSEYLNNTRSDHTIHGYLDIHSYSEEILYPYAYSCEELPRDLENLLELSYGLAKAIRHNSGRLYNVLSSCEDHGSKFQPALGSGTALDYMYHHRARWAFQLKVRDTGDHGFLLPPSYIEPVGREIYASIKYFCEFLLNPEL